MKTDEFITRRYALLPQVLQHVRPGGVGNSSGQIYNIAKGREEMNIKQLPLRISQPAAQIKLLFRQGLHIIEMYADHIRGCCALLNLQAILRLAQPVAEQHSQWAQGVSRMPVQ